MAKTFATKCAEGFMALGATDEEARIAVQTLFPTCNPTKNSMESTRSRLRRRLPQVPTSSKAPGIAAANPKKAA